MTVTAAIVLGVWFWAGMSVVIDAEKGVNKNSSEAFCIALLISMTCVIMNMATHV